MKFRKKPIEIEAVRWDGLDASFLEIVRMAGINQADLTRLGDDLYIDTLEGEMHASAGDWIIKGVKGELYPCKPDIFDATYEPAA
jgi:hypothetical protein